jgi:uncharacterized protein (TIGR02001 family)
MAPTAPFSSVCTALLAGLIALAADARAETTFGFSADVVSDYVLRGVSQTQDGPALQVGGEWSGESGWIAGAWASNVDLTADGVPDDGATVELDVYAGRSWALDERFALETVLIHYAYPGTRPGIDYDYTDLTVAFVAERFTARIVHSQDAYATGHPGTAAELAFEQSFGSALALTATVGHYALGRALGDDYSYWSIGVSRDFAAFSLGLRYEGTDAAGRELWGDTARSGLVAQISVAL